MANYKVISSEALIELFEQALNDDWGYIWGTAGVLWTEAKQEALNKTTDSDRANSRKYGAQWIDHYVADCSGIFTWAFKRLGGYMYHGSDTMYRKYTTANGTLNGGNRTDGQELKPGTAVFVWKEAKKKYTHVGLYVGNGTVIEAIGAQQGVIASKVSNKKWTNWGELTGVDYSGATPEPTPTPTTKPTLRRGSKGSYVTLAQTKLIQLGYNLPKYGADGSFGSETESAVKTFQKDHGLTPDGVIGQKTWEALESGTVPMYTVVVSHMSLSVADEIISKYGGTMTLEG